MNGEGTCPFMFDTLHRMNIIGNGAKLRLTQCIKEKCELWVLEETHKEISGYWACALPLVKVVIPAHCGLKK